MKREDINKVLIIGSGPIVIGQACELNKAGVLDKYGVKVIGVNLDAIERGEDREIFKETMKSLGIDTPRS
ncbi:MAG: hypothetical protein SPL22_11210, partial [Treponema sp.]|uniref:hypothetical protein n=1 Tax=Treponema sp. TaxID=166 RepID=UPI002A9157AE